MPEPIALIMLAGGMSRRFGDSDKLLADLEGKPLAAHTANLWQDRPHTQRIAVVPSGKSELAEIYRNSGWAVALNSEPEMGQSSSLRLGISEASERQASAAMICLADMPFITGNHLTVLQATLGDHQAAMSKYGDILLPPAIFAKSTFPALMALTGDRGAKSVFTSLEHTMTLALSSDLARDVDTPDMLAHLAASAATEPYAT